MLSFFQLTMDSELQPHGVCDIQLYKTETLGTGSYGVVCKAICKERLCAAKLLHPIFFQSNDPGIATTRTRFKQECRFLSEMKHPHIIQYLGTTHDPDSGLLVLLMELMDESLTHFLERSQQPLAYHIEVDLCHDIAQALAYIHSNGIIHRDLSSNNVLLLAGKAKITDFGMSKLLDFNQRMTPLTTCPGTLVYMPPEALLSHPVYSNKLDCFSYGVLEIQIMTRQFPDPGPPMKAVKDPRSPVGRIHVPVLDSERRKSHIDLINPTHTLLPTALNCLSYTEEDRPSAQDLCQQLATFKETPRYTQSAQQAQKIQELQQQLQTKDQQLQDSQRCIHTLQKELQDSQRQLQSQNEQLTHKVEEKHHTIEDREQQLWQLNLQLQANEQITVQFQQNLIQHEQTIRELREINHQLQQERLQAVQEKQHATEDTEWLRQEPNKQQLQPIKPVSALEHKPNVMQQETRPNLSWKQSKAPETISRGSVAVDANMVYCNGYGSTTVHSYDFEKEEWGRVRDCSYIHSCLVIVQGTLTTVGGQSHDGHTNSLLSLTGEGTDGKWSPCFPAMPTKRRNTAAIYNGCSLIVAGGYDGVQARARVEVLDTNTQQWSIASSLLHPYYWATLAICGDQVYMLGGWDQHGRGTRSVLTCSVPELLQSCQTQSLAGKLRTLALKKKQVWRNITDVPHYQSTCSILRERLIAVGGCEAGMDTTAISAYNERTDSWEAMADMPTARHRALVVIASGKMMVIGGRVRRWTELDTVEISSVL